MDSIRKIQTLNKRELDNAVPPEASWHSDYRDTAYIYIGGLPYDLSEGDIITIFSQFGEPVHVNLARDKGTGKSRGFAFLKYEDQRSTDLAVDNLGGATVLGRMLRVDHTRYKRREEEGDLDNVAARIGGDVDTHGTEQRRKSDAEAEALRRPMLKEEKELMKLIQDHDDEDPMKEYLIREKKEEVSQALEKWESSNKKASRREDSGERSHRSRHHHHRRRHDEHRSGARESSHQDAPTERRSYRDRSPRRRRKSQSLSRERGSFRDKSHSRDRSYRGRQPSRERRGHRNRSPTRSRSPERRQHGGNRNHDRQST